MSENGPESGAVNFFVDTTRSTVEKDVDTRRHEEAPAHDLPGGLEDVVRGRTQVAQNFLSSLEKRQTLLVRLHQALQKLSSNNEDSQVIADALYAPRRGKLSDFNKELFQDFLLGALEQSTPVPDGADTQIADYKVVKFWCDLVYQLYHQESVLHIIEAFRKMDEMERSTFFRMLKDAPIKAAFKLRMSKLTEELLRS